MVPLLPLAIGPFARGSCRLREKHRNTRSKINNYLSTTSAAFTQLAKQRSIYPHEIAK